MSDGPELRNRESTLGNAVICTGQKGLLQALWISLDLCITNSGKCVSDVRWPSKTASDWMLDMPRFSTAWLMTVL